MNKYSDKDLYDIANLFKIFSDSTRIRILASLLKQERNVSEITTLLNMNQSATSHQLKILNDNKLVKKRKDGKTVYYSLADKHVYDILSKGLEHIKER